MLFKNAGCPNPFLGATLFLSCWNGCLHIPLHTFIARLTNFGAFLFRTQESIWKMKAEISLWRWAYLHPHDNLHFRARRHFIKYRQIHNYDHVSACHRALRCATHLMWRDFVPKQSNVNPDAFESRDINPVPRLPIPWAGGPETMRESEMTGERATALFYITYSAVGAWWFSLHFTRCTKLPRVTFRGNIVTFALVKFSFD